MNTTHSSDHSFPDDIINEARSIIKHQSNLYKQSISDQFALSPPDPRTLDPLIASYASAHSLESKSFVFLEQMDDGSYQPAGTALLEEGPLELEQGNTYICWRCPPETTPLGLVFIQEKATGHILGKAKFVQRDDQWMIELVEGSFKNLMNINHDSFVLIKKD